VATVAVDGARLHYDVDQPEAFNRVLGDFLAALPPDPA
jgi:hypothetical protein